MSSELRKIRDNQMMLKAAYGAWIRAKNKKTAIVYTDENGDIVKRNPSGHKRIAKRSVIIGNATT